MEDTKGSHHLEGAVSKATLFELPEARQQAPIPATRPKQALVLEIPRLSGYSGCAGCLLPALTYLLGSVLSPPAAASRTTR